MGGFCSSPVSAFAKINHSLHEFVAFLWTLLAKTLIASFLDNLLKIGKFETARRRSVIARETIISWRKTSQKRFLILIPQRPKEWADLSSNYFKRFKSKSVRSVAVLGNLWVYRRTETGCYSQIFDRFEQLVELNSNIVAVNFQKGQVRY